MRVAVHLPGLEPSAGGGHTFEETVHEGLLACADDSAHEFLVYSQSKAPLRAASSKLSYVNFPDGPFDKGARQLALVLNQLQDVNLRRRVYHFENAFERDLKRRRMDLVWFATTSFHSCGLPYIYTVWDLQHALQPWFPEVSRRDELPAREAYFRRAVTGAARVIVPNAQGAKELQAAYPIGSERLLSVTHPTPAFALERRAERAEKTRSDLVPAQPYLLYPAQFWPHKNHITLLKALQHLNALGESINLVLVGSDKGNAAHVRELARRFGVEQQVRFLGFVSREELTALYLGAAALSYVTLFGPENLPPLEAFGLGCPVVASNVPGAQEQLGDAALLVEPMDAEGFALAIRRVLHEPGLRERLTALGRARAEQFTGRDYVRRVLNFVDEFALVRAAWGASPS